MSKKKHKQKRIAVILREKIVNQISEEKITAFKFVVLKALS